MSVPRHDFATIRAIGKMEKAVHKPRRETSIINLFFQIIVVALLIFIIGYIIIYKTIITGNSIYGAWAVGVWFVLEIMNFVWVQNMKKKVGRK